MQKSFKALGTLYDLPRAAIHDQTEALPGQDSDLEEAMAFNLWEP